MNGCISGVAELVTRYLAPRFSRARTLPATVRFSLGLSLFFLLFVSLFPSLLLCFSHSFCFSVFLPLFHYFSLCMLLSFSLRFSFSFYYFLSSSQSLSLSLTPSLSFCSFFFISVSLFISVLHVCFSLSFSVHSGIQPLHSPVYPSASLPPFPRTESFYSRWAELTQHNVIGSRC